MCPQTQTGQNPYLARLFNPANREAVITESFDIAESRLEADSRAHVDRCWKLTRDLYEGRFPGYRSCNTEYHDFNHTCDVFGASVRLCDGALARGIPIEKELHADIVIAAMLHDAGFPGYDTEFDILRKTLGFYELTKKRLIETLDDTASFALDHFASRYGVPTNLYLESIERQMDYLRSIIEDDTVNFRKKLKRLDLESISASHASA